MNTTIQRLEWRTNNAYDSIIGVSDSGRPLTEFTNNEVESIKNFLVDAGDIREWQGSWIANNPTTPETYGELIATRWEDGTLDIEDADLLESRMNFWF